MKKKVLTISTIATVLVIITTAIALCGRAVDCIDKKLERMVTEQISKDPRLSVIPKIKEDTEEIKLLIAIMNKNNPRYKEAMEMLKARKN